MSSSTNFSRRQFFGRTAGVLLAGDLSATGLSRAGWWPEALAAQADPTTDRRREYLAILQRVLRPTVVNPRHSLPARVSRTAWSWEDWLEQTGELPPDFLNMPSHPLLPDPLVSVTGEGRIETLEQWSRQKEWIRDQYQQWIVGRFPPPPENLTASVTRTWQSGEATVHETTLRFGPESKGRLRLDVLIPEGSGPFPAFLTQYGLQAGPWAELAVRRGYIGCVIKVGSPTPTAPDDSDAWIDLYPDHEFPALSRWAWAGMRAVDHLLTLPEVDPDRIAIAGNSRYAKASLIAAAFDERISAVVPSRGNGGGGIPWRHATGMFANQELEELTRSQRNWFHPRLRFFSGREDKLPVDQNMLLSLVAPRGLMLSQAYTEYQGNPWAIEQSYRSAKSVYEFLGAEDKLGLLQRPGEHTVSADVVELYLDFLDSVFDRTPGGRPEIFINNYTFEALDPITWAVANPPAPYDWASDFAAEVPWGTVRRGIQERVEWVLGETPVALPPLMTADSLLDYNLDDRSRRDEMAYPASLFDRPFEAVDMGNAELKYGDGRIAEVYYGSRPRVGGSKGTRSPRGYPSKRSMPTVIWLHPYAYAIGYSSWPYALNTFPTLVSRGFNVVGVDLMGHGTRVEEMKHFYGRYPNHSALGRMVGDMSDLVTSLSKASIVDPDSIYVVGSGLGAKVGLFLAALDERVRGVVSVCGFSSLRDRAAHEGTEGLKHYTHLHGLLPRLAGFAQRPESVPIDYDDVLALIAPRPTLLMAPTLDRYHKVDSVRSIVEKARTAFAIQGDEDGLELETPEGFNGFEHDPARKLRVIQWLEAQVGL
jgi:hypothetical protein